MSNLVDKIKLALVKQFDKNVPLPQARRNVEKQLKLREGQATSFDHVYFNLIGAANPIEFPPNPTKPQIRKAIRARRNGTDGAVLQNSGNTKGMSLLRWEAVRASASAGLSRELTVKDVRDLYGPKPSYAGRGTRIAVPETRLAA